MAQLNVLSFSKFKEKNTSRSRHTDPRDIRAKRRVKSPWQPRSAGDPSRRRQIGRMLKEMGIAYDFQDQDVASAPFQTRITIRRPRPGYVHPLEKVDLLRILNFVGAEAVYGLRSIALARQPDTSSPGLPLFGRLIVPGQIKIYEQPIPPWRIPGILPKSEAKNMRRTGAQVEIDLEIKATFVQWPEESLHKFMIFEVLLHEIGHHILQHSSGKRSQRVARTRDHEAFARRFADRCRSAWFDEETSD